MTTVGTRTGNFELVRYDGRKLSICQTNPSFTSYVKDLIFIQRIIKKKILKKWSILSIIKFAF